MKRQPLRAVAWFALTAVGVYALLLAIAVGLAMANGEGVACRDAECGPISDGLDHAAPLPLIGSIALSLAAGAFVARRRTRS